MYSIGKVTACPILQQRFWSFVFFPPPSESLSVFSGEVCVVKALHQSCSPITFSFIGFSMVAIFSSFAFCLLVLEYFRKLCCALTYWSLLKCNLFTGCSSGRIKLVEVYVLAELCVILLCGISFRCAESSLWIVKFRRWMFINCICIAKRKKKCHLFVSLLWVFFRIAEHFNCKLLAENVYFFNPMIEREQYRKAVLQFIWVSSCNCCRPNTVRVWEISLSLVQIWCL